MGPGNGTSSGSGATGSGGGVAPCWAEVGRVLNARAESAVPARLRARGFRGAATLVFTLAADGRAQDIAIEDRQGPEHVESVLRGLFVEPLPAGCAGRGRWRVEIAGR